MRLAFLEEVIGRVPGFDGLPGVPFGLVETSLPPKDLRSNTADPDHGHGVILSRVLLGLLQGRLGLVGPTL